jgi:hypothetical protein
LEEKFGCKKLACLFEEGRGRESGGGMALFFELVSYPLSFFFSSSSFAGVVLLAAVVVVSSTTRRNLRPPSGGGGGGGDGGGRVKRAKLELSKKYFFE